MDKPMILKRKDGKQYGTKKMVEGCFKPKDRCIVIEDVVTSGGSIFETIEVVIHINLFLILFLYDNT